MSAHEYYGDRGPRQLTSDPSAQRFFTSRTYLLSFLGFDEACDLAPACETTLSHDQGAIKVVTEIETEEHSAGQRVDSRLGFGGLPVPRKLANWECTGNDEDSPPRIHLGPKWIAVRQAAET